MAEASSNIKAMGVSNILGRRILWCNLSAAQLKMMLIVLDQLATCEVTHHSRDISFINRVHFQNNHLLQIHAFARHFYNTAGLDIALLKYQACAINSDDVTRTTMRLKFHRFELAPVILVKDVAVVATVT